jgi:1A family penicillin-binding protein
MPFGRKYQRFSKQKYSSFNANLGRSPRRKITKLAKPTYKRGRSKGFAFDLSHLNKDEIISYIKYLFTTKEGLKKVGFLGLVGFGFIFALFVWYAKDLPTPNKINSRISAQSTQIFDRNGKLLYEVHGDKNRILADWNEVPDNLKNATVAIEDKNFYKHGGFSLSGIARAFTGIISGDSSKGGGSTITQQFVKNALLTNERSFTRKIKEVILAIEIEQMYKKDDILKMYLNEIPYGSNAYGVKVAAKTYFNKDLKDLTLEESATLAALPQAPTYYSPFGNHKDALMARKNQVLDDMVAQKYVTKEQAEAAKEKTLVFSNNPYGSINAPHFVMYVKEQLVEKYGERAVEEGGLKVYTTLDWDKQQMAESSLNTNIDKNKKAYNANNASLVSIDPKTGQILAMVGSRDFFDPNIDGNVNVALMGRQPGSSFKPFAYATAWKTNKWGPGSVLYDVKTDFGGGYIPNNYDGKFRGPVTMRKALDLSLNIPAVKTLYLAGMDQTLDTAHAMGITTLNDKSQYGLSLVLGAGEVKLLDMTSAYGVFANGGVRKESTWLLRVEDSKGKVVEEYKNSAGKRILDPQVAYLMSNVLSDDPARAEVFGRGGPLTLPGRPAAAKTGTTNDYKDAWTMGYTPSLVTGVWVGNNDGTKMTQAGGSIAAAPIWHDYMTKALAGTKVEQFQKVSGVKTVNLDAITGDYPATGRTVSDIFPSWYQAPAAGSSGQLVKIDKQTGKLASDKCPVELTETRRAGASVNAEIPSNDPSYSRWFAPIQAWASANGFPAGVISIPTEYSDCGQGENPPKINITSPTADSIVEKDFTVNLAVDAPNGVDSVKVKIGSITVDATPSGNGYVAVFKNVPIGSQTITATVKDKNYQTQTDTMTISVGQKSLQSQSQNNR